MARFSDLVQQLITITGKEHLIVDPDKMRRYTTGARFGDGNADAVAIPGTLEALWQVLQACVTHDAIILMQAANTGVTGGSTPDADGYDRPLVIVSTRRLAGIQVIEDARQVIAFPGTTLTELEDTLKPLGREPHSVLGSSCIGASVIGGICNNSGGSLVRRGPAFTEKSLFARLGNDGRLELVNHLGIDLGDTPEAIFNTLASGKYQTGEQPDWDGRLWADDYPERLRDVDADTPTRFNADPRYLHEGAGSAGKVAVFAVRLPTFEASEETDTFYIGTPDEKELIALRRHLLRHMTTLPIQAEYLHEEAFDTTLRHARHALLAIRRLGPEAVPDLLDKKARWDALARRLPFLPDNFFDKALQLADRIVPHGMPSRIMAYHKRFEHHLMIKVERRQRDELARLLNDFLASGQGEHFHCNEREQADAFLLRFCVGLCTPAYCAPRGISTEARLQSFDIAMRRNDDEWRLRLPDHLQEQVMIDSCCGHFLCYVLHQDYILRPGVDITQFKKEALAYVESRGARYPAEHNVGHHYDAADTQATHWRQLDPCNTFNPGIGNTSRKRDWAEHGSQT